MAGANLGFTFILQGFSGKPFEPMTACPEYLLAWKTKFLVAARNLCQEGRRSHCFMSMICQPDLPYVNLTYLTFHMGVMSLVPGVIFFAKSNVQFPFTGRNLSVSFPLLNNPQERCLHLLGVKQALLFYLDRTKKEHEDFCLFIIYTTSHKGHRITVQRMILLKQPKVSGRVAF